MGRLKGAQSPLQPVLLDRCVGVHIGYQAQYVVGVASRIKRFSHIWASLTRFGQARQDGFCFCRSILLYPPPMDAIGYDHGVFLRGSQLWFDAERRRQLCVVCTLHRTLPPLHKRVLAPAPLAGALTDAGYAGEVLPLPYNRWVGLGGHRLQLVPTGACPGQAATLVETAVDRILWAGALTRPDTVWNALGPSPKARWPKAHRLVVRLPALRHQGLPLAQVALQLAAQTRETLRLGLRPVVHVESVAVGWALWEALSDLGLNPRPLGLLRKVLGSRALPAHPSGQGQRFRAAGPSLGVGRADAECHAGTIRIDTGLGTWDKSLSEAPRLHLGWYADTLALHALVEQSGAHEVYVLDVDTTTAQTLNQALGPRCRVMALAGPQPPLTQLSLAHGASAVLRPESHAPFEAVPRGVIINGHESTA